MGTPCLNFQGVSGKKPCSYYCPGLFRESGALLPVNCPFVPPRLPHFCIALYGLLNFFVFGGDPTKRINQARFQKTVEI